MKLRKLLRTCFCSMAFIAMTGCVSARIGDVLSSNDPDYPVEKPSPERIVELYGKLPSSLELKLTANYRATTFEGCRYAPTRVASVIEGVSFPIEMRVPLILSRGEGAYSTAFIVDRYQPGRCGWRFSDISAEVSKAGKGSSIANNVVFNAMDRQPAIQETWGYNSQNTPVVWRCRFSKLTDLSTGMRLFVCGGYIQGHKDKYQHLLNADSKRVEINFIDLESQ